MLATVTTVWEPVTAVLLALGLVGGAARWVVGRLDARFDRLERRLDGQHQRIESLERDREVFV